MPGKPIPRGRGPSHAQRWIAGFILTLALFVVLYHVLVHHGLEQTAALFIALPAVLASSLVLTIKPKSATGAVLLGITLVLLTSGILVGEGFVCILVASPLAYLVGLLAACFIDLSNRKKRRRSRRVESLAAVPFLLVGLEGVHEGLSFSRSEAVEWQQNIGLGADEIVAALEQQPRFDRPLPPFLRLGFPKPVRTAGGGLQVGDRRSVHFSGGEGSPGDLVLEVREREAHRVVFACVSDESHIAHWMNWESIAVEWYEVGENRCRVRWTLHYERLLDPAWYFRPLERYAVRRVGRYLADCLEDTLPQVGS